MPFPFASVVTVAICLCCRRCPRQVSPRQPSPSLVVSKSKALRTSCLTRPSTSSPTSASSPQPRLTIASRQMKVESRLIGQPYVCNMLIVWRVARAIRDSTCVSSVIDMDTVCHSTDDDSIESVKCFSVDVDANLPSSLAFVHQHYCWDGWKLRVNWCIFFRLRANWWLRTCWNCREVLIVTKNEIKWTS